MENARLHNDPAVAGHLPRDRTVSVARPSLESCFIAVSLIGFIFIIAMQPAALGAIQKLDTDPQAVVSLKEQYSFGFRYFWPITFLMIIQGLIFLGSAVFLLIPAIIIGVYTGLYIFMLVLEGKRGFASLTASYSLIRGRWSAVFGRIIFLALLYLIGGLIISGAVFIVNHAFGF